MILNESSRDNLLQPYVEILKGKGIETNVSQLKQFLLAKFVNEAYIRNLSLDSNYYLAGVTRYYFEGKLTTNKRLNIFYSRYKDNFDPEVCKKLNALILILRNAYIDTIGETWEQPEDFGELPIEKLFRKYGSAIKKELSNGQEDNTNKEIKIDRGNRVGNGYTFDILYSYEDARKYNKYTEPGAWCITYGQHHYDYYVSHLKIHYVIFAKDGYENVKREKGPGWTYQKPQDEYGNSLIALLQSNKSWEPVYITSRWNHGAGQDNSNCEADHAYTTEEFLNKTGVTVKDLKRIYEIWKADYKEDQQPQENKPQRKELMRKFKYAQMKLNGGNFDNLFGETECKFVKLMTNNEKFKNLDALSQEPSEQGAVEKKKQKLIKSSIALYSVNLFNGVYYFLRDGNKILFDSIIRGEDNSLLWYFSSTDTNGNSAWSDRLVENKHNLICIRKPKSGTYYDHDYALLYDYRKHKFVEVEGVKKFKYVTEVCNWESQKGGYYEVANSQVQRALIDLNTNNPIVLPNGRSWIERIEYTKGDSVNYSRSVNPKFYPGNKGLLKLTVDSSSGEVYFFDMMTKEFFTPIMPDGIPENIKECQKTWVAKEYNLPDNYTILSFRTQNNGFQSLYVGGKPTEMLGKIFYRNISYTGIADLFVLQDSTSGKKFFYDKETDSEIKLPQGIENNFSLHKSYTTDRCVVLDFGEDWRNEKQVIYDAKFKTFFKNPLYDNYVFMIYSCGSKSITIYEDNDRNSGYVYDLTIDENKPELSPKFDDNGEVNKRRTMYESLRKLNKNDIRNMVFEVINKLFYK